MSPNFANGMFRIGVVLLASLAFVGQSIFGQPPDYTLSFLGPLDGN